METFSNRIPASIEKQYDNVGLSYITEKNNFFSETPDPGKEFIFTHLSKLADQSGVDVGCGGGEDIKEYLSKGIKNIVGVDPSSLMVEEAKKILGTENAVIGSWTHLPFPDNSKNYLVGRFSLHYAENLDEAYKEATRVLTPGGALILVLPHPSVDRPVITVNGKKFVHMKIFEGKVDITYPRHSLEDYFSPFFNSLFEVTNKLDYASPERGDRASRLINSFAFIARKR